MTSTYTRCRLSPAPEGLTATLSPQMLGLTPGRVWNPSPSQQHRTEPYNLPQTLEMGIRDTAESGAKFSPPPFAVIVLPSAAAPAPGPGSAANAAGVLVSVVAEPGWHRWNQVRFTVDKAGVTVHVDLEGHTDPAIGARHIHLQLLPGQADESLHSLLARGLALAYPTAGAPPAAPPPAWWLRPIYCGWGDQVTAAMYLEGQGPEPRALAYCIQGLYERWIARLDKAQVPIGTIIIDAGWSPAGTFETDDVKWPDLKGFIARQHEKGRKVLLWLATWLHQGLPPAWCIVDREYILTCDPTHPEYRRHVLRQIRHLISPQGLDADGFKIDQLSFCPNQRQPRGGPRFGNCSYRDATAIPIATSAGRDGPWGCELLYQHQKDIYDAAKSAKSDCLITSSTVHPLFSDSFDMTRLHDMGYVAPDIFAAMAARADLSRAALPGKPIDTDDWVHSDYNLWLRYTMGAGRLGVPCLFYAERFMANWQTEPATTLLPESDLQRIAAAWRQDYAPAACR